MPQISAARVGVVARDHALEPIEPDRVRIDVRGVVPAVLDDLAQERIHERLVRAVADREMDVGLARHRRRPRIHGEHPRRVGAAPAIEHAHPEHGLRLGDVVTPQRDRVAVVDVAVGARLPVGAEARLERRRRGGRAETRVAVHVRRAEARLADHGERVVLLEEELAARVEPEAPPAAGIRAQLLRALDDAPHRRVPVALDELAALADQRTGEAISGVVGLPAVEILRVDAAVIDAVDGPPAHADDAAVLDRDVEPVAVGMQDSGTLNPAIDVRIADIALEQLVDAHRPRPTRGWLRSKAHMACAPPTGLRCGRS